LHISLIFFWARIHAPQFHPFLMDLANCHASRFGIQKVGNVGGVSHVLEFAAVSS
jgi:hypothetical protein